jgi:hypothetical protein
MTRSPHHKMSLAAYMILFMTHYTRSSRIVLPVRQSANDAVHSFMLDCLVPLIAERFLRDRDVVDQNKIEAPACKSTFAPLGREDGV